MKEAKDFLGQSSSIGKTVVINQLEVMIHDTMIIIRERAEEVPQNELAAFIVFISDTDIMQFAKHQVRELHEDVVYANLALN